MMIIINQINMRLKIIKRKREFETNLELPVYLYFQDKFPVYLYFQDELCNDELVKITEKEKITIKFDYNSFTISVETDFTIDLNFQRYQTTEKHFNETYSEALKKLSDAVGIKEVENYIKDYRNQINAEIEKLNTK